MMKNGKILLILVMVLMAACSKPVKPAKPVDINKTVDSIVQTKIGNLKMEAADDLDKRMAIEVKAKTDSIVAANNGSAPKPDTTAKPAAPPAPSQAAFKALLSRKDTTRK